MDLTREYTGKNTKKRQAAGLKLSRRWAVISDFFLL